MHMTRDQATLNPAIKAAIEKANARKLPAKAAPELDGASEKQVVNEICTALRMRSYCTPREWKPGARGIFIRVGQLKAKGSGTDEGAPDLIVVDFAWHPDIGNTAMRKEFFEVKARTKDARLSKEQAVLAQMEIIHIVNSAGQVLALLEA